MCFTFQLFKAAIDETPNTDIPYYWHRNYALACEQMLRIEHKLSKEQILKETIFHFEQSLTKNPLDEDASTIQNSVKNLKTYIGKLK